MIYDSKLKRMKNVWQQFVGSHKTIIELWSGVLSFCKWCKMIQFYRNILTYSVVKDHQWLVLTMGIKVGKLIDILIHSNEQQCFGNQHISSTSTCLLSVYSTSLLHEIEAPAGIWVDAKPWLNESPSLTDKWYIKLSVSRGEKPGMSVTCYSRNSTCQSAIGRAKQDLKC